MNVAVLKIKDYESLKTEVLVLGVFLGGELSNEAIKFADGLTGGALNRFIRKNKKFGKSFESVTFHISPGKHGEIEKVVIVGLGKKTEMDNFKLRQIAGYIGKNLTKDVESLAVWLPDSVELESRADTLVVGLMDGSFDAGHHKSEKIKKPKFDIKSLVIVSNGDLKIVMEGASKGLVLSEAISKVKEVVNQPANVATPQYMVNYAKKIATDGKLKIEVFSEKQVIDMGMGIMASVARGSEEDLYLVVLRYLGAGSVGPTLAIVGKGITFDSGGISIKPSESMEWMKMDMAGAAACFGAMEVLSKLKPKVNVICVCPLTENLPSGRATKPGDVVKGLNGKTVEVINTDAEGRLVLSDALSYVQKNFKPDYIVDLATLTGASIVALGNVATAALGRPQNFVDKVIQSGEATGERMWQLPLYAEYRELLKSYIADIANVSGGRGAGTETGAKFLEEFVADKQAWVHLDIAPTAWEETDKPYAARGATGFGVTTLVELALNLQK